MANITQFDVDNQRETRRQAALSSAIGGFQKMAEQDRTKRQEALAIQEHTQKLRSEGYDVDEKMVKDSLKEEQSGLSKFFAKTPIGQSLGLEVQADKPDLYAKRTKEYTDKQEVAKQERKYKADGEILDRDYKRAMMAGMGVDNTKKLAEVEKLKAETAIGPTPKENEFKAAGFSKRARQAEADLAALPKGTGTDSIMDTLQGNSFFPDALKGEKRKLFEQAKDNFISANLRKESGAAIGAEERAAEDKKYFPQPGDSDAVIAQKARSREQAMLNLEAEGGTANSRIANAPNVPLDNNGWSGSAGNKAMAADPVQMKQQLKTVSREDKIKMLRGN